MNKYQIGDRVFVCCYKGIITPKTEGKIIKIHNSPDGYYYEIILKDSWGSWCKFHEDYISFT